MTTLLVASGGGHLEQLLELMPRIQTGNCKWVTYDTPQTRSLLEGADVVHAFHPTTKNIPNALRNYLLARRVLEDIPVQRVVSTGAAVAVPFVTEAVRRGVPAHYIESATRVTGPSLSGRMLQLLRPVRLYRQTGTWGSPRWQPGPSVFDGFQVGRSAPTRPRIALLSLGTHSFPFPRLVKAVDDLARATHLEVVWQLGGTTIQHDLPGRVLQHLAAAEFRGLIRRADVVIGHAGTGLALTSLSEGRVPVLIPRRAKRGEHTDDHQLQIARELAQRGLAVTTEPEHLRYAHLEAAASRTAMRATPPPFPLVE